MLKYEKDYLDALNYILDEGKWVKNKRTGVNCLTVPFLDFTYTPEDVPLLTVKQCYPVSSWAEMLGYYRRYDNAQQFADIGSPTWFKDANKPSWQNNTYCKGENDLGKVYGAATEVQEIPELLKKLALHQDDRGLILNFWRPELFDKGCLRSCVYKHNFNILDNTLYLRSSQRSMDFMCGAPFNSFSLWFKNKLFSEIAGLEQGLVKHDIVNAHIYEPHLENAYELLRRKPLDINPVVEVSDWVRTFNDIIYRDNHARDYFTLTGYEHLGKVEFEMITD